MWATMWVMLVMWAGQRASWANVAAKGAYSAERASSESANVI